MTEREKLKAKDFIGYIEKHKISKSDVIKLSEYYKNIQPTLGFAKIGQYEKENIIPITKQYGFNLLSRSGLEIAIKRCILITEENYDELISSIYDSRSETQSNPQNKKEEPEVITQTSVKPQTTGNNLLNNINRKYPVVWVILLVVFLYFIITLFDDTPSACECQKILRIPTQKVGVKTFPLEILPNEEFEKWEACKEEYAGPTGAYLECKEQ